MTTPQKPETIDNLEAAVHPAFAMLAGMKLDLFTPLKDGPLTARQIAESLGVNAGLLERLLHNLVIAELLTVEGERFSNTAEADHFLVRGTSSYIGGRHVAMSRRWNAILKTAETITAGLPQARIDFSAMSDSERESYFRSLNPENIALAQALAERFDFTSHKYLLDAGGGAGGLAVTLTESFPDLGATVAELPTITPFTHRHITEMGAADRVQVMDCDIVNGPLEGSFDVAVMSRLLQVLSPEQAQGALRTVSNAISAGGTVHIIGHILDDSRRSPREMVAFDMLFLNTYGQGQAYTEGDHAEWLNAAGFESVKRDLLPNGLSIITAQKPG